MILPTLFAIALTMGAQAGASPSVHQFNCSFDMGRNQKPASLTVEVSGDLHNIAPERVRIDDPGALLHGTPLSQAFAHIVQDGTWRFDFVAGDNKTGDLLMLMGSDGADHFDAGVGPVRLHRPKFAGVCVTAPSAAQISDGKAN